MRQIKFRFFDTTSKKIYKDTDVEEYSLEQLRRFSETDDPYTKVMQYTGLKDKNGVEIYEGDIQKQALGSHYWIYVVKSIGGQFGNTLFSMTIRDNLSVDEYSGAYTFMERIKESEVRNNVKSGKDIEIIGNIYETHLCTACKQEFATCKGSPVFGKGFGKDNVIVCHAHEKEEK